MDVVAKKESVSVEELCQNFHVSSVTIRKDLTELEKEGLIVRTHGGAVPVKKGTVQSKAIQQELAGNVQQTAVSPQQLRKMQKIAEVAKDYIPNQSCIYLSSGYTCYEIARKLQDKTLTVVTGGINTAQVLSGVPGITVMLPGGTVTPTPSGTMLSGEWYLKNLDDVRVDIAFISVGGIDLEQGYSLASSSELLHIRKLKEISRETVIVADSTKFGLQCLLSAAPLDYIDTVITNSDIPDAYRNYYRDHGIRVLTD